MMGKVLRGLEEDCCDSGSPFLPIVEIAQQDREQEILEMFCRQLRVVLIPGQLKGEIVRRRNRLKPRLPSWSRQRSAFCRNLLRLRVGVIYFTFFKRGGGNTFCLCRIQSPAAGLNAPIWNTAYDRKTIFLKLGEISEKRLNFYFPSIILSKVFFNTESYVI